MRALRSAYPAVLLCAVFACSGEDPGIDLESEAGAAGASAAGNGSGGSTASGGTFQQGKGGASANGGAGATGGSAGSFATGGKGSAGTSQMSGGSSSGGRSGSGGAGKGGTGGAAGSAGAAGAGTAGEANGGAGGSPPEAEPGCIAPVNPNATEQAKNLFAYLCSIYGESVLSGQQETSWVARPEDDVEWINQQTGKYPAVLGGDYLYPNGTTNRARAYWEAGGIPMIRYHMGAPPASDTYDNSKGSTDIDAVLRAGTSQNNSFNSKLDYVARELGSLQSANVAVIWAPFHEVQPNGWFWWAKGTGPQFVALWKYMYEYLTDQKGLNNLIWLLPFSGSPDAGYYPGKAYVDLAGPDTYEMDQPFTALYSRSVAIVGTTVPIPLHETGVIPDPDEMFPSAAPWLLFSVWAGYQRDAALNPVANIKATYANSRTITRDEVPNLK